MTVPTPQPPSCPRCGYDLSGQADADRRANAGEVPPMGRCSECGLEFLWIDIFEPFRNKVRGFIEHVDRGFFLAAWRTWALALRPSRFWKLVRIEYAPQVSRFTLWLLIVLGVVWAIGPIFDNAANLVMFHYASPGAMRLFDGLVWPWVFGVIGDKYGAGRWTIGLTLNEVPAFVSGPLAAGLIIPIMLLGLPDTRRRAKVRAVHVLRAAVYSFAWLVPVLVLKDLQQVHMGARSLGWVPWARSAPGLLQRIEYLGNNGYRFIHSFWVLWLAGIMAWLLYWWWSAMRVGWRLEECGKVMRALTVAALLAAAAAVALSNDGYRIFM